MEAKDLLEFASFVCLGFSTYVSLKVQNSFEKTNTAIVQLELRITKAIDEASGKQSAFVEQARRAATTSIQRSKENRTAIAVVGNQIQEQKGCLEALEQRMNRSGVAP